MIITFLGHSLIPFPNTLREKIKGTLLANVKNGEKTLLYCGGYGDFDNLCASVCFSLKNMLAEFEIIYVTPYIRESHIKQIKESKLYDSILYPPIEKAPLRFAINERNKWMIKNADLVIAYVKHNYGGTYKCLEYAKRRKKKIINLATNN